MSIHPVGMKCITRMESQCYLSLNVLCMVPSKRLGFGKRHSRISYVMRLALSTVHLHSHGAQGGLHQGYISDHHSAHEWMFRLGAWHGTEGLLSQLLALLSRYPQMRVPTQCELWLAWCVQRMDHRCLDLYVVNVHRRRLMDNVWVDPLDCSSRLQ